MSASANPEPTEAIPFRIADVDQTIADRFEEVARRVPDRIAVSAGSQQITYRALDHQADLIAHAVVAALDGSPAVVATLLGHQPIQIAALLGILKAGAAYVALDPASPKRVLEGILADSQSSLLLTDALNKGLSESLSAVPPLLSLEDMDEQGPDAPPHRSQDADSMAYLVYTSGSTGSPKGVPKSHAAMLYTTYVAAREYAFRGDDRISLLVSMSFAAARFGFLGALLNGARLSMYDLRGNGVDDLAPWLEAEGVTILHMLPSTLRVMLKGLPESHRLENVRAVVVGGEPLTRHDLEAYRDHFSRACRLVNTYGASETGVISRASFTHETQIEAEILPVGRPVEGQRVSISPLEGAEGGESGMGEIWVRGRTVAPGYWRDAALSAERFRIDPQERNLFSFRTGDLGRIDADGTIWVLGRGDQQIKILGQRIHIEAIESAIERHADVRSAAVLLADDDRFRSLHAFIVSRPERPVQDADLRAWLLNELPMGAIPSVFHAVEALPRTAVGKIDRSALRDLLRASAAGAGPVRRPRDALEQRLLEIWSEALDVRALGVEDDYFALGGDSLRATRLFSMIEKSFGVRLPLASLYRAPTIAAQAELIRQGGVQTEWSPLVAVQPLGERAPIYCVSPLVVDVLAYRDLALQIGLDRPFYALYAYQGPRMKAGRRTVRDQARRYIQEIQKLQPEGPYILSGYSNGGKIAFEMAVQLAAQGQVVRRLILLESYGPDYLQRQGRLPRRWIRRLVVVRHLQRSMSNLLPWLAMHTKTLRSLGWPERVNYVRARTDQRLRVLKAGIKRQYAGLLRLTNPDKELYETPASRAVYAYRPSVYAGDVAIIRAKKQLLGVTPDPYLGWRDFITGNVSLIEVPGYHDSILFGPRVSALAAHIRSIVDEDRSG